MKQLLNFALIFMVLTFFVSCEKEQQTDIQIIENQLKNFVRDNGITRCSIILMYGEKTYTEYENVEFSIINGFVVIKSSTTIGKFEERYNLLYLSKYMMTTDKLLMLYFANTHF